MHQVTSEQHIHSYKQLEVEPLNRKCLRIGLLVFGLLFGGVGAYFSYHHAGTTAALFFGTGGGTAFIIGVIWNTVLYCRKDDSSEEEGSTISRRIPPSTKDRTGPSNVIPSDRDRATLRLDIPSVKSSSTLAGDIPSRKEEPTINPETAEKWKQELQKTLSALKLEEMHDELAVAKSREAQFAILKRYLSESSLPRVDNPPVVSKPPIRHYAYAQKGVLHYTLMKGDVKTVTAMLLTQENDDEGVKAQIMNNRERCNQKDRHGRTFLHDLAECTQPHALPMVELILPFIKDINTRDPSGETPLDTAIINKNRDVGVFLIGKGARTFKQTIPESWRSEEKKRY